MPEDDTYVYLASIWATPELDLDGDVVDCFIENTPEANPEAWDAKTYWPESALAILKEKA